MKKGFGKFFIFAYFMCFSLLSCSTTLKMNVTRPAKLDLHGAKSIAVLPFSQSSRFPFYSSGKQIGSKFEIYSEVSSVEQQALNFMEREIERGLMDSPYINLVSSTAVKNALRGNGINPAEVYITGEMVAFNIFDDENILKKEINPEDVKNFVEKNGSGDIKVDDLPGVVVLPESSKEPKENSNIVYEKFYTREVLMVFNYQVVDGTDDNVLYFNTLKINHRCDPVELLKELPDPYLMISNDLEEFVDSFLQLLQPYGLTRNITLLNDKTKNPEMEHGDKLAKDGRLRECYTVFLNVYNKTGLFEAGYNAAMVLMVLGDFNGAETLMRKVYTDTGNVKASEGLSDIMNEISQAKILEDQIGKN